MPSRGKSSARLVADCAVLTALSMILSYIDSMIPLLPSVPGIKIGLANLVILVSLYLLGFAPAFLIDIIRVILSGLLFTGLSGALYSLSGALLSFAVMALLKRSGHFSEVGVSIAGGAAHNLGQLLTAVFLISNPYLFYYYPVLTVTGCAAGILTGFLSHILIKRLSPLLDG